MIKDGYILLARQIKQSDIWHKKPIWLKIWLYLLLEVSHSDNKHKRGTYFFRYDWITKETGATYSQVEKCIKYLKQAGQIATQKATQGIIITALKYDKYQDGSNYKSDTESDEKSDLKAKQKRHESDNISNNGNNGKEYNISEPSSPNNNSIKDLYSKMGIPKPVRVVNLWQDEAANAVKYFSDGEEKKSSVFKCFKDNQQKARIAFSDCKELEKTSVMYFLKVFNELNKK
jgi:hypothetical protein